MKWLTERGFVRDGVVWDHAKIRALVACEGVDWVARDMYSDLAGWGNGPREALQELAEAMRRRAQALDAAADAVEGVLR